MNYDKNRIYFFPIVQVLKKILTFGLTLYKFSLTVFFYFMYFSVG